MQDATDKSIGRAAAGMQPLFDFFTSRSRCAFEFEKPKKMRLIEVFAGLERPSLTRSALYLQKLRPYENMLNNHHRCRLHGSHPSRQGNPGR
jgi:hypothetical protein